MVAAGVLVAYLLFGRRRVPVTPPPSSNPLIEIGRHDLYGDALNEAVFMRPGQLLTRGVVAVDDYAVDGAVVGGGQVTVGIGAELRRLQNGYVRSYALTLVLGVVLLGVLLVIGRLV